MRFRIRGIANAAAVLFVCGLSLPAAERKYEEPPLDPEAREHWSFRPLGSADHEDSSIDSILLKRLEGEGLPGFAPRAAPDVLLRRLHFTLTGLPPGISEIEAFDENRIGEKIDELLASLEYGERWAQHWLDVVRFAETDGFEHDKVRPEAWRYRDWVIDALNRDLPYDEFVARQIAGEEWAPDDPGARDATGFLFAGPDMPDINLEEERRHNVLNEMTGAVGAVFLGLTLGCAQCHDHKSDPVSQADFYRMRAFFENAELPPKNRSLPHFFSEAGPAPAPGYLRMRGDFRRKGPELEPAVLRVIRGGTEAPRPEPAGSSTGYRRELARWLTDPGNPLVARVIVNRVWQHHFGRGLVETPNDFGLLGGKPSHPELLDWLATELVRNGWSLKKLHRTILLSRAWQQASRRGEGNASDWGKRLELDPENRLLSRRQRVRLSGEAIRDSMLKACGKLNPKSGGPGFRPPLPGEVTVTLLKKQWEVTPDPQEHLRRSIYLFARRNLRYPLFDVFDRPDGNESCGRRHRSTTATQSLTLLNGEFSDARARDLADRVEGETGERIRLAYLLTLGREPGEEEKLSCQDFLEESSFAELCLALFNCNEFVFLD